MYLRQVVSGENKVLGVAAKAVADSGAGKVDHSINAIEGGLIHDPVLRVPLHFVVTAWFTTHCGNHRVALGL
jgi:hypothetical protein